MLPYGSKTVCLGCQKPRNADDFPVLGSGKSQVCTDCVKARRSEQRTEKEKQAKDAAIRKLVSAAKGNEIDVPHISEVAGAVVKKLGGLEVFAQAFADDIGRIRQLVYEGKQTPRVLLDADRAVFNLIVASTEHRSTAPDVEQMSIEELQLEVALIMAESAPK
jgi:hypothetical protein